MLKFNYNKQRYLDLLKLKYSDLIYKQKLKLDYLSALQGHLNLL